ncbi:hypothetical protein Nepgr_027924 [Nepenthes gracilis]|uniref:Uncharacterized protein n=1 Tax=Nepenthes gracilis TaxID=150966 RepID=A0AAD3TBE7_NEPGR|nr:hypothetical protein Nepgr_027924 [Nepenthes gracilis]
MNRLLTDDPRKKENPDQQCTCDFYNSVETSSHVLRDCYKAKRKCKNILGRKCDPVINILEDEFNHVPLLSLLSQPEEGRVFQLAGSIDQVVFSCIGEDNSVLVIVVWEEKSMGPGSLASLANWGLSLPQQSSRLFVWPSSIDIFADKGNQVAEHLARSGKRLNVEYHHPPPGTILIIRGEAATNGLSF